MEMDLILAIGLMVVIGFFGGCVARKLKFPRITGYIIIGVLLSPSVLNVISKGTVENLDIITEYDVLHILSPRKRIPSVGVPDKRSLPYSSFEEASHLMSRDPIKCELNEKVENILDEMITHRIKRMPVVENGDIIGEITLHHLIRKLYALIL